MNINDLRPAAYFAQQFGVKAICYGPPGTGKTPLVNTAPNPVLVVCEPGMLSMRGSQVPAWYADTPAKFDEFFQWVMQSKEAANFDTLAVDSVSHLAYMIVEQELNDTSSKGNQQHGLKAYGNMAERVMKYLDGFFFMRNKHIYLIAQEGTDAQNKKRPHFPGKELHTLVPHRYDEILHLAYTQIPGVVGTHLAFRTRQAFDVMARDRSGVLGEFEEPHLGKLITKIMQGVG